MAQLLNEIVWEEPLVAPVVLPEWESEAKRRFGGSSDYLRRVALVPWLREACAALTAYPLTATPVRLADIAFLVVAQENACRYCYGAARAHMHMLGYSDRVIGHIERELELAELDGRDQAFIRFCRNLARSNPRPAKAERDELLRIGFAPETVKEMAFLIVGHCFHNRVATFLAIPPVVMYERLGRSFVGRLLRPVLATANRRSVAVPCDTVPEEGAPFAGVTRALAGLPAAHMLHTTLQNAYASPVLSRRVKALAFGVIAKMLDCRFCVPESARLLAGEGFTEEEVESCLSALGSPRLDAQESAVLGWVRETVRYQPHLIQKRTRALAAEIGPEALLEAVGVAALANATVRLATLLE